MSDHAPEFHLFLPQMRMDMATLVERAQVAEANGFAGVALMDHLAPPMAESQPMFDAMVAASWLLASTKTLTVSHLVLCDAFRHPAVLAKQAVSLDHASGGRFELGLGWGSVPDEFETFGVGDTAAKARVARLAETLQVVKALWTGEPVDFDGEYHQVVAGQQMPGPLGGPDGIPIVIGGAGPKTLDLVAEHATWWNCPLHRLDEFEAMRPRSGNARASTQQMVAFVPDESQRADVEALTAKRFGSMPGVIIGTADELVERYQALADQGIDRFYVWCTDFAAPATLEGFGSQVISAF